MIRQAWHVGLVRRSRSNTICFNGHVENANQKAGNPGPWDPAFLPTSKHGLAQVCMEREMRVRFRDATPSVPARHANTAYCLCFWGLVPHPSLPLLLFVISVQATAPSDSSHARKVIASLLISASEAIGLHLARDFQKEEPRAGGQWQSSIRQLRPRFLEQHAPERYPPFPPLREALPSLRAAFSPPSRS